MEWRGRRQSQNVDDRRGTSGKKIAAGGGIGAIVIAVIMILLGGGDLSSVLNFFLGGGANGLTTQTQTSTLSKEKEDEYEAFAKTVLGGTEDVWTTEFRKYGKNYTTTTMVLFTGATSSGCGNAQSETGPFYCSQDKEVYIDLSFFEEMEQRFAKGDFPKAYVIAHEVGHHVQDLLGTLDQVHKYYGKVNDVEYNKLSVRLELQADFYAGYFAQKSKSDYQLTDNDIREALTAAQAIGDDRLQQQAQGRVVPDSFTHGTSEQRMRWFKKGYTATSLNDGDTFTPTYESL